MYCRRQLLGYVEEISHFLWLKSREGGIKFNYKSFATGPPHVLRRRGVNAINGLQLPMDLKPDDTGNAIVKEEPLTVERDNHLVADMDICSFEDSSDQDTDVGSKVARCLFTFRYLETTEYGHTIANPLTNPECIRIVTYNVLAQTLLGRHSYLYQNCNPRVLPWRSRRSRLREEFRLLNADILCLQEVEAKHVEEFYDLELGKLGYKGVYKQRTGGNVDGCAIYFKKDRFTILKTHCVELYKDKVRLLNKDNIGVILRLRGRWPGAGELVVATTHLLYNPNRSDIRLTQTQIMLAEIEHVAYNAPGEYCPVIFTGDMNYTPDSAVYRLVTEGNLEYEGKTDRRNLKRRLLPPSLGVTDRCQYTSSLEARRENDDPLFETGILSHDLNLGSAYSHVRNGLPEATTFQEEWHTVDYIFYSQKIRKGLRQEGKLKLVSRLSLPTSQEASNVLRELPNDSCGSDHLPLYATFHLTS